MYLLNATISYQMAVCLFIWQANISIFIYVETWELYYSINIYFTNPFIIIIPGEQET